MRQLLLLLHAHTGEGWEGFGLEDATQETAESPHAHAESDTKAELDLQASTMDASDEATAVSDTVSNDKGVAESAVPAPETTADHAALLDSHVQTETGVAFLQEAAEAEEEGWGELDNDVLTSEDDAVPLESAAADVEAEQAPKTAAGDVSIPEVEAAEEEEGSWEGLEEELDLHSAEETHSVEEAQPVETEVPAEETQAAQPADAEVSVSSDAKQMPNAFVSLVTLSQYTSAAPCWRVPQRIKCMAGDSLLTWNKYSMQQHQHVMLLLTIPKSSCWQSQLQAPLLVLSNRFELACGGQHFLFLFI